MSSYIVVRLVPDSPVDGGTFSTYLDDLRLQAFDVYTGRPLSDFVYSSPYVLTQWSGLLGQWISVASLATSAPTQFVSGNYGSSLTFESTDGIPEGSFVFTNDQGNSTPVIPANSNLQVTAVIGASGTPKNTVTLNNTLPNYVPAGTVVTFIAQSPSAAPNTVTPFSFTLTTTSLPTTIDGQPATSTDPLIVLSFADVDGVAVGMTVSGSPLIPAGTTVAVANATTNTIILSQGVSGTPSSSTIPITFTQGPPFASIQLTPTSGTPAANPTKLKFPSGKTNGIAVGMTVVPIAGLVAPGTTVISVNNTTGTFSKALLASLPSGQALTFIFPLSSGIVQHTEVIGTTGFFGLQQIFGPASVATAIIPLFTSPPLPDYVDITIGATRGSEVIPVKSKFYNVLVSTSALPATPDQYQNIPSQETSLYFALPPTAGANTISLVIPSDGSAPQFDALYSAIQTALQNDGLAPATTIDMLIASPQLCTRIAYDIVWSYQNLLPAPPDPLESLYTNPPNPGGSNGGSDKTNNLEQDRQKFEGTLNSFYSTRNATAERLIKFVAAVSGAVVCEQASLSSTSALLEFPVDPASSFASSVESELLLNGVNLNGTGGVNFGVPAGFFYAIGASLDKSTTAMQRFQLATGDSIERVLHVFSAAEQAGSILDTEDFKTPGITLPKITSFQAVRRLSALGVSAVSNSPSVPVYTGTPFAQLVSGWLSQTDPTPTPAPNPPLSYQQIDFNIWTKTLGTSNPLGYLYLDLDALTRGFVIPSSASTLADKIVAWLPSLGLPQTIEGLKNVSAKQWTDFFTTNPGWLPPFTQPAALSNPTSAPPKTGYIAARIRAFIRAVQRFFTVSSVPTQAQLPQPGAPCTFDLPTFDPIALAVAALPAGFQFGNTFPSGQPAVAAATVFLADQPAQDWLTDVLTTINELWQVASVVQNPVISGGFTLPNLVSFAFSVAEALYARGFRTARDISNSDPADFQQALIGTMAYDFALSNTGGNPSLYQQAQTISPPTTTPGQTSGSFHPINPDGSLVNCVPPPCLSPTGPIAYLQEMLNLSQASTCETPFASPGEGGTTLGSAVTSRRGPVGKLLASCANLDTPLPTIDIVNECLEYLGTAPVTITGTVYDTSEDELAGYALCNDDDKRTDRNGHDPVALYAALPEYSTPATPTKKNQEVEPLVYNYLKSNFSSCDLPYSQALDVSRTYLHHFGSCRFEEMRTFRKCITEFALDPANPPAGFQSFLWRYPVRIDIAIEYLGITPEEYTILFQGTVPPACGQQRDANAPPPENQADGQRSAGQAFGFTAVQVQAVSERGVISLPEFLAATCLSYCEFVELSKSGVPITLTNTQTDATRDRREDTNVPDCEPCCLGDYQVQFLGDGRQTALRQLAVFIRLWRKLKSLCGAGYTFAYLYDMCTVLRLFNGSAINPEFIRHLAAFQMLRDQFQLPLCDPGDETPDATGVERTHLLALWIGSGAKKWNWAKHHLLEGIEAHARSRFGCPRERGEQIAHMADNLDALARLGGFNPGTADVWNANPGCTLRFAEVLTKLCASDFRVSEVLYLFNADSPPHAEHPFPLQDADDVLAYPLDVPEDSGQHSLWKLREELLKIEVDEDDWRCLSWTKIIDEFRRHFGYAPPAGQDPLLSLGQHFFPCALEESGCSVSAKQRQYRTALASTTAWNAPPGSPFQYDASASELWIQLPVSDEAVAAKLGTLPPLNAAEQAAAQDLYFAPRLDLAFVAFLFSDWQSAELHLIQESEERERWHWFQRHFALANARRNVIAAHVAKHVAHRTGCRAEGLHSVAELVMSRLYADENTGSPWDSDNGVPPNVMWTSLPAGGAIPALLGLVGTGLLGEYKVPIVNSDATAAGLATQVIWREVRGPMQAFGHERDATNSAVPTVLPPITLLENTNPLIAVHNGYAVKTSDGHRLGGAEPILVRWSGSMLVEREGEYRFHAGAPTPEGEKPNFELAEKSQWRVTLQRGSKTFAVLNHEWPGNTESEVHEPRLRRGAYQITVEYSQPAPDLSTSHPHRKRTGFQAKYAGPDTDDCLVTLPIHRLYREYQDQTLDQGITFLPGSTNAQAFLKAFYTSTLRDIRRTYQRAFKAVLFSGKLDLSARRGEDRQSELGYMLANPANFVGYAYYRTSPSAFMQHLVNFDFNFLPLQDNYHPPAADARTAPSLQQSQGMFDWWERLYDYTVVRKQVQRRCKDPIWHLFEEAHLNPSDNPVHLLRHIGAEPTYWTLDLRYYQDQWNAIYAVSDADLQDDRWLVRVWHADRWVRCLMERFHAKDISNARPDLWASDDPSAPVPASGNANLLVFVNDACFEEHPRRYADVKRLNDGLRERGRTALVSYLCHQNRVPLPWSPSTYATKPADLSDLLLLDVETGVCEKASRIEEAISTVQTFIRRSRLGLEPNWTVGGEFIRLWDSRFDTYRLWEQCKRRELYRENWIEWTERGKARRIEAFRFLESELRKATLTLAAPGGLDWWQDDVKPLEQAPMLIQNKVPSELQPLTASLQSSTREGLATLGSPEYAARPTWLAAVPQGSGSTGGDERSTGAAPTSPKTVPALAKAAADGSAQPVSLPLWMESAMKLGTRFLRIAAAGVPQASLGFKPRDGEPRPVCCRACGCDHPVLVDEYYFWLEGTQYYAYTDQTDAQSNPDVSFTGSYQFGFQDSYYDAFQLQSAEWHDEDRVPALLAKWQPNPAVRLAWCRIHNGQFGQPRKSDDYVAISDPADLIFLGRGGDSLYFQVSGSAPLPPGYSADPSPPGFRYDLAPDEAVGIPQAIKPPALPTPSPYPGGLLSYPFFAFHNAGARLFPGSWFSPSMAVAEVLRARCGFELALKWYRRAFDPLNSDCTWMVCDRNPDGGKPGATGQPRETGTHTGEPATSVVGSTTVPPSVGVVAPSTTTSMDGNVPVALTMVPGRGGHAKSTCCDSSKVTDEVARQRAVMLQYCQTLMDWGDALMRRRRSPEAFQQARFMYDTVARITGRTPQTILLPEPASPLLVTSFTPANPPLNPRLMDLYSLIDDRLDLIRTCLDARRLRNGQPDRDLSYWGDNPLRGGWRTVPETCVEETEWCHRSSPYRFVFQIQKAHELVGRVRELGAALLAAYEKGDAEALASIRAGQERDMLTLGISIRQDQWRDADWQVQALQQTKDVNQTNLLYYTTLYQNDLINDEIQNLNLTTNAMQTRTGASLVSAIGEVFQILPDSNVGAMSTFLELPTGKKMASMFDTIARIMQTVADIQSTTASMDLTQAGWQRRSVEWLHQMQTLPIEIQQIELQILGAQRRRDQAMQELNNQQRQIENATDVLDFLRDKFTATDLYLFLQKETSTLYRTMYDMAYRAAGEAQRAFNFERGHTTRRFIPEEIWDNLHEGLMAGERLDLALRHMEKAYLDENVREYELTKHVSLRSHFPMQFLRIKETGCCEIKLPEWMFDLDYPGQYMRRIKNVTLTIPCVTGPYTGVHCRATLLRSVTRIDPRLEPPVTRCCGECEGGHGYDACPHDPRMVRSYAAREAIATSNGQNDAGLFELNFRDERYLPFEYQGAVSHWRLELPPENNYFDMDTLSDVILNLNYTSREGGGLLRHVAMEAARAHLPGDGWCFFDVRHEFPDGWQMLRNSGRQTGREAKLELRLERKMFPFLPGSGEVAITNIAVLFHARGHGSDCSKAGDCRCQGEREPDSRMLEFTCRDSHRKAHSTRVVCVRSAEWPDLYYGLFETEIGPIEKRAASPEIEFRFPHDAGGVETVYLLCRYRRSRSGGEVTGPS